VVFCIVVLWVVFFGGVGLWGGGVGVFGFGGVCFGGCVGEGFLVLGGRVLPFSLFNFHKRKGFSAIDLSSL